jgi:hypothetical protein
MNQVLKIEYAPANRRDIILKKISEQPDLGNGFVCCKGNCARLSLQGSVNPYRGEALFDERLYCDKEYLSPAVQQLGSTPVVMCMQQGF